MLKKLYGFNDASCKFWLRVKRIFNDIGLRKLDGDEAVYYKINGMILIWQERKSLWIR